MTPALLLSVWRARWARPDVAVRPSDAPPGPFSVWFEARCRSRLAHHAPAWVLGWGLFALLALTTLGLRFGTLEQGLFGLSVVLLTLVLQGAATDAVLMVMGALTVWMGLRYAHWRLFDSLSPQHGLELGWMFSLLILEWFLALAWWIRLIQRTWPLTHTPDALPTELARWPQLGVVLQAAGADLAAVQRSLAALRALTWPTQKLALLVLDEADRADLRELARHAGAYYAINPQEAGRRGVQIDRAVSEFEWPYALIVAAGAEVTDAWLHASMGHLLGKPSRGLVSTPAHPWLSATGDSLAPYVDRTGFDALLVRRAAYIGAGGFGEEDTPSRRTLDQAVTRADHQYAAIGPDAAGDWLVVPAPLDAKSLRYRAGLTTAWRWLSVFWPHWLLVFVSVPVLYATQGLRPMAATPVDWLVYALPAWLTAAIYAQRLQAPTPRSLKSLWTNWPLLVYLAIATPFVTLWTLVRQTTRLGLPTMWRLSRPGSATDWAWVGAFAILAWTAMQCLLEVLWPAPFATTVWAAASGAATAALLWLMLIGLAMRQEATWIEAHLARLRESPVSVRSVTGRTVTGSTLNFPALPLQLRLHKARLLDDDSVLSLTLMHDVHALNVQAPVLSREGNRLSVSVTPDDIADYTAFAQAVLSRPADWPTWLPPPLGFKLRLPRWLTDMPRWPSGLRWPLRLFSKPHPPTP